jgi:hypothetical protein
VLSANHTNESKNQPVNTVCNVLFLTLTLWALVWSSVAESGTIKVRKENTISQIDISMVTIGNVWGMLNVF